MFISDTWQTIQNEAHKAYVKGLFSLLAGAKTQEDWDGLVDLHVCKVFTVPMAPLGKSVNEFWSKEAQTDESVRKAVQLAEKKSKSKSKRRGNGKSKTALAKELALELGPLPGGPGPKVDTMVGKKMGKSNKDGTCFWRFPPRFSDAEGRAKWKVTKTIMRKGSKFGALGTTILMGHWVSTDPDSPFPAMTDADREYYLLKKPSASAALAGGSAAKAPEQVDELAFMSGAAPAAEEKEEEESKQEVEAKEGFEESAIAAAAAAEAIKFSKLVMENTDAAIQLAREKKLKALERWAFIRRLKSYKVNGTGIMMKPMNMDTLIPILCAKKHIMLAIEHRCKDKKKQKKSGRNEQEQFAHWFSIWDKMETCARQGKNIDHLLKKSPIKTKDLNIYEGMPIVEIRDRICSLAFKKNLAATADKVELSNESIGQEALDEYYKEYADQIDPITIDGVQVEKAKWVTDLIDDDDEGEDGDESDDDMFG